MKVVGKELTVSKVEEDKFRYTGLNVKVLSDGMEISMEEFTKSMQSITEIRRVNDRKRTTEQGRDETVSQYHWETCIAGKFHKTGPLLSGIKNV